MAMNKIRLPFFTKVQHEVAPPTDHDIMATLLTMLAQTGSSSATLMLDDKSFAVAVDEYDHTQEIKVV